MQKHAFFRIFFTNFEARFDFPRSRPDPKKTPLLESAESRMSADSFNRQPKPAGQLCREED